MNNREFIDEMSAGLKMDSKETQRLVNSMVDAMVSLFDEGNEVCVAGFGTFEVKKKNERIIVHPGTGKRILVPPKMVLNFKQSNVLKSQVKGKQSQSKE
jgi:nucleoid DNA-binding protein